MWLYSDFVHTFSLYSYVGCFHVFAITSKVAMAKSRGKCILSMGCILVYLCLKLFFGLKSAVFYIVIEDEL